MSDQPEKKRKPRATKKVDDSVVIINPEIKKPLESDRGIDEAFSLRKESLQRAITLICQDPEKFTRAIKGPS